VHSRDCRAGHHEGTHLGPDWELLETGFFFSLLEKFRKSRINHQSWSLWRLGVIGGGIQMLGTRRSAPFEPPGFVVHPNFSDKLEREGCFASLKVGFGHAHTHAHRGVQQKNGVRVVRQVVLAPCLGDPWLEHSRQYVAGKTGAAGHVGKFPCCCHRNRMK